MLGNAMLNKPGRRIVLQSGVSLIEVLVSIVIASIGLLALAGVNASSARYTKMSQYRGTATLLANDMGERMRANKAGLASYSFTSNFAAQATLPAAPANVCHPVPVTPITSPVTFTNPYTLTPCTSAAQVAADDLQSWQVRVRDQLPEGSVHVIYQNLQSAADVWVVWRDPAVASDDLVAAGLECPGTLGVAADPSVRCSYFRFNI